MSRQIGDIAEARAADFLHRQGFVILARNYTIRGAEVDIIAQEGACIAFVEVKYRKRLEETMPRESVTRAKQLRIGTAALRWLQASGMQDAQVRFDIVEVSPGAITLLRNAFVPDV